MVSLVLQGELDLKAFLVDLERLVLQDYQEIGVSLVTPEIRDLGESTVFQEFQEQQANLEEEVNKFDI